MLKTIKLPSVMALGWIPYYKRFTDMSPNDYHTYAEADNRKRLACDVMFFYGNETPPEEVFEHHKNFQMYLMKKDYRIALMLYDIELHWNTIEHRGKVDFKTLPFLDQIGYTPYRPYFYKFRFKWPEMHCRGEGTDIRPSVTNNGSNGIILSHQVHARVGEIGNWGNKVVTGYELPYVWMRVDYSLKFSEKSNLFIKGSYIPSQLFYSVEAKGSFYRYYHNMENNNITQIESVLASETEVASSYHSGII